MKLASLQPFETVRFYKVPERAIKPAFVTHVLPKIKSGPCGLK